ncbi:MAG: LysE family transporter [Myxococcota bacterium]|nr:LysE family transporter [Myxococcota bacterium]
MFVAALIGFLFGFVGSMPVAGPIAALVFARALEGRMRSGLHIAIGGAVAESLYAALAFWGFAELLERYAWIQPVSNGAAAVILSVLGVIFIRQREEEPAARPAQERAGAGLLLGFTITALNPTLIATWAAAAATLLSTGLIAFDSSHAAPFSLGAMVGIVAWFAVLLRLVAHFRDRFSYATLAKVIRVMGWCLLVLAGWFAWRLVG